VCLILIRESSIEPVGSIPDSGLKFSGNQIQTHISWSRNALVKRKANYNFFYYKIIIRIPWKSTEVASHRARRIEKKTTRTLRAVIKVGLQNLHKSMVWIRKSLGLIDSSTDQSMYHTTGSTAHLFIGICWITIIKINKASKCLRNLW